MRRLLFWLAVVTGLRRWWATIAGSLQLYTPVAQRGHYRCDGCGAVEPYGGNAETNGAHGGCPRRGRWRPTDY